jgi:hypothetical protein
LRRGWWEKPLALEIDPDHSHNAAALASRGWKVVVVARTQSEPDFIKWRRKKTDRVSELSYPDLHTMALGEETPTGVKASTQNLLETYLRDAVMVRFGSTVPVSNWINACRYKPRCLILTGPLPSVTIKQLRKRGYSREARVHSAEWPRGGPDPSVLNFENNSRPAKVKEDESLYLMRDAE